MRGSSSADTWLRSDRLVLVFRGGFSARTVTLVGYVYGAGTRPGACFRRPKPYVRHAPPVLNGSAEFVERVYLCVVQFRPGRRLLGGVYPPSFFDTV